MTDINLKTLTPDTSLPTTGFLFGADSQASTNPSVYSTQTVATTLLGSTSLTGDTLTADAPVLNLAQTWNNGAVTFTGMKFNVASDTSAAASLLMDLQVNGATRFSASKSGTIAFSNGTNYWSFVAGSNGVELRETSSGNTAGLIASTFEVRSTISANRNIGLDGTQLYLQSGGTIGWNNSTTNCFSGSDLILTRRAAARTSS